MDTVTKEDWIIMRLLITAIKAGKGGDRDVVLASLYLGKKYSLDVLEQCGAAIRGSVR